MNQEKETITRERGDEVEVLSKKIIQNGQVLRLIFYPSKNFANLAFQGKIGQNAYVFDRQRSEYQPKLEFKL